MIDEMIGREFGNRRVLRRVDNYVSPKGATMRAYQVKCQVCGSKAIIRGTILRSLKANSCKRCADKERGRKLSKGVVNRHYLNTRNSARKRGLKFDLSLEQFSLVVRRDCFYCGLCPSTVKSYVNYKGGNSSHSEYAREGMYDEKLNGIDRKDPCKGYELRNVVPCCWDCNRAKGSLSLKQFLRHIRRIAAHQGFA